MRPADPGRVTGPSEGYWRELVRQKGPLRLGEGSGRDREIAFTDEWADGSRGLDGGERATGLPPHQQVIPRRVERARQLLLAGTDLSLVEVAADADFSDQSRFSRHFKRRVGGQLGVHRQQSGPELWRVQAVERGHGPRTFPRSQFLPNGDLRNVRGMPAPADNSPLPEAHVVGVFSPASQSRIKLILPEIPGVAAPSPLPL